MAWNKKSLLAFYKMLQTCQTKVAESVEIQTLSLSTQKMSHLGMYPSIDQLFIGREGGGYTTIWSSFI